MRYKMNKSVIRYGVECYKTKEAFCERCKISTETLDLLLSDGYTTSKKVVDRITRVLDIIFFPEMLDLLVYCKSEDWNIIRGDYIRGKEKNKFYENNYLKNERRKDLWKLYATVLI